MRLVYLSPVPWASFAQRPHAFVRWMQARSGAEVLWVDPYPTRLPAWSDMAVGVSARGAGDAPPAWLTVAAPRALPLEPIAALRGLNRALWAPLVREVARFAAAAPAMLAVGKPSQLALHLMDHIPFARTLYDAMDDFAAFYTGASQRSMAQTERHVAGRAGTMLVSSTALAEIWRPQRAVTLVRNACSPAVVPPASPRPAGAAPTLGYVGTVAAWFDWPLLEAIAAAAPRARIEIIGPVHCGPPRPLPANVALLPAMRHAQAIAAMQRFSAGLIPFVRSRLTDAVDPVKYYEYRACGLPVISSAFGEMSFHGREPGVFLVAGDGDRGVEAAVAAALAHREGEDEGDRFRQANNWAARFDAACILGDV
jgi:hypothetical protein